ncbi:unnamed protein product [Ectocarpus sp. 13 AM-2016]
MADAVKLSHSDAPQENVGLIPASTCSTRGGNQRQSYWCRPNAASTTARGDVALRRTLEKGRGGVVCVEVVGGGTCRVADLMCWGAFAALGVRLNKPLFNVVRHGKVFCLR